MAEATLIEDVYTLGEKIGEGGMAAVYRAEVDLDRFDYTLLYAYTQVKGETHHERRMAAQEFREKLSAAALDIDTVRAMLGAHNIPLPTQQVAVKIAKGDMDIGRFEAEWQNLICLGHDHVVKVFGGGTWEGRPYYAMELLENIVAPEKIATEFSFQQKLEILSQAGRGLAYLHKNGIVHRDVKPDNMVTVELEPGRYATKVADLGIAKNVEESMGLTATGAVMGTPYYMAPEQIKSSKDVDHRADIYSLGASLYRLVTGAPPYHDKTTLFEIFESVRIGQPPIAPKEHNPSLPDPVVEMIQCAMANDPENRYKSMDELVSDLETYVREESSELLATINPALINGDATTANRQSGMYNFERILSETKAGKLDGTPTGVDLNASTLVGATGAHGVDGTAGGGSLLGRLALAAAGLLLAAGAVYGGWTWMRGQRYREALQAGKDALAQRRYADAKARFTEALEAQSTPEAQTALARVEEALARALERRQLMAEATTAATEGDTRGAAAAYGRVLKLAGYEDDAEAKAGLQNANATLVADAMKSAATAMAAKDWDAARAAYAEILELDPDHAKATAGMREARAGQESQRRAARFNATFERGVRALESGDPTTAAEAFEAALAIAGFEEHAEARSHLRDAQKAIAERNRKATFDAALAKGKRLLEAELWDQADRAFSEALFVDGYETAPEALMGRQAARDGLARMQRKQRFQEALTRGQRLLQAKEWEEAEEAFVEALAVEGYETDRGAIHGRDAARTSLAAARLQERYDATLKQARAAVEQKDYDGAIELYEAANRIQADGPAAVELPRARKALAKAEEERKRKQTFEEALAQGEAQLASQNWKAAETAFDRALAVPGYDKNDRAEAGRKAAAEGYAASHGKLALTFRNPAGAEMQGSKVTLWIDGRAVLHEYTGGSSTQETKAGLVTLEARAPGYQPYKQTVQVAAGGTPTAFDVRFEHIPVAAQPSETRTIIREVPSENRADRNLDRARKIIDTGVKIRGFFR